MAFFLKTLGDLSKGYRINGSLLIIRTKKLILGSIFISALIVTFSSNTCGATPGAVLGKADDLWEEMAMCIIGATGVRIQAPKGGSAEITLGKANLQSRPAGQRPLETT